jgi:hypothetical protein
VDAQEALGEHTAIQVGPQLTHDEAGDRWATLAGVDEESLEILSDDLVKKRVLRLVALVFDGTGSRARPSERTRGAGAIEQFWCRTRSVGTLPSSGHPLGPKRRAKPLETPAPTNANAYAARAVNLGSRARCSRACSTRARFVRLRGNAVSRHLRSHTHLKRYGVGASGSCVLATQSRPHPGVALLAARWPAAKAYATSRNPILGSRS